VSAWFKTDGNDNSTIVSHWYAFSTGPSGSAYPFGWQLALSTNNNNVNLYLGCPNNCSVTIAGSSNVKDGNWHCASFVRYDRDYQLYVDGQLEGSGSQSTNLSYSGQQFQIGSRYNTSKSSTPGGYFNGDIDEVHVSSTARSADWMKASFLSENDQLISIGDEVSYPADAYYVWKYARPIYIDATNISGTLTNFPICVKLYPSKIKHIGSGGADLRFSAPSYNFLKYEIESWDEGLSQ
jgi:hypothetical protein